MQLQLPLDIWRQLFRTAIDSRDAALYKSLAKTCRAFREISAEFNVNHLTNHLWTLIYMYPDGPWSFIEILKNPNTPLNLIKIHQSDGCYINQFDCHTLDDYYFKNMYENNVYDSLSKNPNITWSFVCANKHKCWNWTKLLCHPNFSLDDDIFSCEFVNLFKNAGEETVLDVRWPWCLSSHPNVDWNFIEDRGLDMEWDWLILSQHRNFTWEIIKSKPGKWDWRYVSCNPNVTMEIVAANPEKQWDYVKMSFNPNLTWDFIIKNITREWNWNILSRHPNVTWDIIINNRECNWNWNYVSMNPNITWEIICANPNSKLRWYFEDPNCIWSWRQISLNPNITWQIVRDNPQFNWDFCGLSENTFGRYKLSYVGPLDFLSI
jgi:hypothetical protein